MKKAWGIKLLLFVSLLSFAEDPPDTLDEEDYYDYGMAEGIIIYGEFPPESVEAGILARINGLSKDREQFIEEDLLRGAGFQRNANAKFRPTTGEEKALSVWHGVFKILSLGLVPIPQKPFKELEYAKLPMGEFYGFDAVIYASPLKDVPAEVRTAMELEYMLQVEFCNGAVIRDWNQNYYTEKNITKFEELAKSLPESPPSIKQLKDRYLDKDLPGIKAALEHFNNPGENFLRAMENFSISPHF
ncbi:hypothetical protein AGMMS4952_17820 [Spirochaetia bacterium]|nr:hypothetical protein AGMMS4952_17820 [Spirochaetia bacterium]